MICGNLNFFKLFRNYSNSTVNSVVNHSNLLNSAQVAFVNRLGIHQISPQKFLSALNHPRLSKNNSTDEEFKNLIKIGDNAFSFFAKEYIKTRFPLLEYKFAEIGWKTFLNDQNVLKLAGFLGIDAACGIDSILREKHITEKNLTSKSKKAKNLPIVEEELNLQEIRLDCFKALLGLIALENGPLSLRSFLDSRYFNNSQFNPEDLIRPLYPIPDLSLIYPNLIFRLHQESGRLSSNSMFIVGVYKSSESQDFLGEGHGPSVALAQQRAAIDALRRMDLKQVPISGRLSDNVKTMECIDKLSNNLY